MKKTLLIGCFAAFSIMSAQDHFSGINTSRHTSILNVNTNPAELSNLSSMYEINILSTSINVSNNKVGIKDINGDINLEDLIFKGTETVNARVDAEIYGPGFAMKMKKWAFSLTSKGYAKSNIIDVDPRLGDAISNGVMNSIGNGPVTLSNDYNQRMNGTSWGEIGLSAARTIYENETHKFNAGVTLKLLFPGSYANFGMDQFKGTITNLGTEVYLNNTQAAVNIAYSGKLAESFNSAEDYFQSIYGKMNGFATDFGANYRWKDKDNYRLNVGLSVKNIGSMTFKDSNNVSTNYNLNIHPTITNPNGLPLSQFQDAKSITDIEKILLDSGYLTKKDTQKNFKTELPTVFTAYADVKVIPKLFVTVYTQQKLKNDNKDNQITTQNVFSLTPRFSSKNYEVFVPLSKNEISGSTAGLGFRIGCFYMGSGSAITALINNSKQADLYLGFRFGLV